MPPRMTLAERRSHKRREAARASRNGWKEIAALPTIQHHGESVRDTLSDYLHIMEHEGARQRLSFAEIIGEHNCPVCVSTLAMLFRRTTGLEMRRGHNDFTAKDLAAARVRFDAFWAWREAGR